MVTSIESRLWLAVHLLYSNASQAFDVYQAVILQSEQKLVYQDSLAVFAKLAQVYDKIPAISSNLAFYEFEFEEIDQWKIIYKNSQKTQLIIFIGMLIFELKISNIAEVLKLPSEKAQFLFHQIFKKLASTSQKLKYNEQLEFKKQNDNKISYLFTYENLVDHCLDQLSPEEDEKVKIGLKLYPTLLVAKEEYSRIISQIQNLKVQKEIAPVVAPVKSNLKIVKDGDVAPEVKLESPIKGVSPLQFKALIGIASVTIIIILIQPMRILSGMKQKNAGTVVLQEINLPEKRSETEAPNPSVAEQSAVSDTTQVVSQNSPPPPPSVQASSPTQAPTPVPVTSPTPATTPVAASPAPAPNPALAPNPAPAVSTTVAANAVSNESNYEGGLYRGTLFVTDLTLLNSQIKEKLLAIGALKAGEVELGWMKTRDMAYYHYTLPEAAMASMEDILKKAGILVLKFEKHPRKLPQGTRRFIVEVKQK